ncbi:MAG: hypothetical protein JST59_29285 [Actinobacteria bacterium]|nr:hypothetical protein [Actinomycetota bacterium]
MQVLYGTALLALVLAAILPPLLRRAPAYVAVDPRRAELETRKEAKYRELRDAELDHAAGKLSDADYSVRIADLRREAAEILAELEPQPEG